MCIAAYRIGRKAILSWYFPSWFDYIRGLV
jgi:hypothetical protein